MGFTPFAQPVGLPEITSTPPGGFALQNGTPTILTWNVPNDGAEHRVIVFFDLNVTVAETGGACTVTYTNPEGQSQTITLIAAGQGVGAKRTFDGFIVGAGTTVTVAQSSALTVGAASVNVELFGS